MRVQKQPIPEEMRKTIKEVSPRSTEQDSITIIKNIKLEEEKRSKNNKRALYSINILYLLGVGVSVLMLLADLTEYGLLSLLLMSLGALIFNIFIYNETKITRRHLKAIDVFYPLQSYENQKDVQGRARPQPSG